MENKHDTLLSTCNEEPEESWLREFAKTHGDTYSWDVSHFAMELGFAEANIDGLLDCGKLDFHDCIMKKNNDSK